VSDTAKIANGVDNIGIHISGMESRVSLLEKGFVTVNEKLDRLATMLTTAAAQSPWRVGDVLSISRDLLTIGAILGGTVIFISQSLSSGPIASIEQRVKNDSTRLDRLERLLERVVDSRVAQVK